MEVAQSDNENGGKYIPVYSKYPSPSKKNTINEIKKYIRAAHVTWKKLNEQNNFLMGVKIDSLKDIYSNMILWYETEIEGIKRYLSLKCEQLSKVVGGT